MAHPSPCLPAGCTRFELEYRITKTAHQFWGRSGLCLEKVHNPNVRDSEQDVAKGKEVRVQEQVIKSTHISAASSRHEFAFLGRLWFLRTARPSGGRKKRLTTAGLEPATFWCRRAIEAKRATIALGSHTTVSHLGRCVHTF